MLREGVCNSLCVCARGGGIISVDGKRNEGKKEAPITELDGFLEGVDGRGIEGKKKRKKEKVGSRQPPILVFVSHIVCMCVCAVVDDDANRRNWSLSLPFFCFVIFEWENKRRKRETFPRESGRCIISAILRSCFPLD
jgi:hypothetical protein